MKFFNLKTTMATTCIALAGCAAKPVVTSDSLLQEKNATFPKIGQQVHVVTGGLVHLHTNYKSRYEYKLKEPLTMGFFLGRLSVTTDDALFSANLEEKPVFCTTRRVYIDPFAGPRAIACFIEGEKQKFTQVKASPGEVWFTKDLPNPIDFSGIEAPRLQQW